jgi:hypothetical protein
MSDIIVNSQAHKGLRLSNLSIALIFLIQILSTNTGFSLLLFDEIYKFLQNSFPLFPYAPAEGSPFPLFPVARDLPEK